MSSSFDQPMGTVIAGLTALVGVVIGGLLTVWHQRQLEKDKAENARADALAKELAAAVQQLAISMASAVHSMLWLAWVAHARPDRLSQVRIDKYDDEQHVSLPKILGFLSTATALDTKIYAPLRKRVERIYGYDVAIAAAGLRFKDDPVGAAKELGALRDELIEFEHELPLAIGDIVGERLRDPNAGR